ncbi:tetratricopeptide repeat protein [Natronomonas sp. EA1]|uniref:tetratricopeptide repeat protein n=1 Tax=Natronomonas sp. EA1 TaxID=3421655 RepID=UPI003EC04DBF
MTPSHRYSEGQGFGDPYAGFTLEDGMERHLVDPADDAVLADLLADEQLVPDDVDASALIDVGLEYVAIEQYEQAIDAFTRAARYTDDETLAAEAWVNRGVAFAQLEEYDEAIGAYFEALAIDPKGAFAAIAETNLAYALWESGDSSEPLEHAERAVELDPRLPEAWYTLGFLYNERALPEPAIEALDNALALGYRTAVVHGERERALDLLGEDEAAGLAAERVADAAERTVDRQTGRTRQRV